MQPIRSLRLARSLALPIPAPSLPAGFNIRPSHGLEEIEEWVLLHRAAFGTQRMTCEERLAMISAPEYDPRMDLVVTAPDGNLAAYCLCQISREENLRSSRNEGYTDPIATHPAYQGRGLARALLLTGMGLLLDRGVDTAVLGTSSENEKMLRAALAVGYRTVGERVWFEKTISTICNR
jgi:ribosomal protein S18 acetylase RimI-like enzyme